MNLFSKKKTPEPSKRLDRLDDALSEVPAVPVPVVLYIVSVVTELETIASAPLDLESAKRHATLIAVNGALVSCGNTPVKHIPPHRIYELTFSEFKPGEKVHDD